MATVAIVLKTKQKLANNEFAIALRVTHNQTRRYYTLNSLSLDQSLLFKCKIEEWLPSEDKSIGHFAKSVAEYKAMNQIIIDKFALARKILSDYDRSDIEFDFNQFEKDLRGNRNKTSKLNKLSLSDYYNTIIADIEKQQKVGLAVNIEHTYRRLHNDIGRQVIQQEVKGYWFQGCFSNWLNSLSSRMMSNIFIHKSIGILCLIKIS